VIYRFMIIITVSLQFTQSRLTPYVNCSLYMIVLEVWFIKLDQHLVPYATSSRSIYSSVDCIVGYLD
jgi:hypothetical protein